MPSVLITGASGFVGEHLAERFRRAGYVVYLAYGSQRPRAEADGLYQIDLGARGSFHAALHGLSVDVVVHAAALVSPDLCEENPGLARAINVDGTREVAQWAQRRAGRLVYFSTDLVYDGEKGFYREEDAPHPINVYGETKLQGEQAVRELCASFAIVRLSLSYGPTRGARGDWTKRMREDLAAGKDLTLFTDQFRTPAYVGDTAEAIYRLSEISTTGIFHMGGKQRVSRYEFGMIFARIFDLPAARLHPVRMGDVPARAARGRDCSLITEKIAREVGISPSSVEQGLRLQKGEEERACRALEPA
jgi:dTDP-4-dehydrorhamnose reductase